jgi:hypothetical protein
MGHFEKLGYQCQVEGRTFANCYPLKNFVESHTSEGTINYFSGAIVSVLVDFEIKVLFGYLVPAFAFLKNYNSSSTYLIQT